MRGRRNSFEYPRCCRCHRQKVLAGDPNDPENPQVWRCERCDTPPVVIPFMDRSKLFRFKSKPGREDSPGWDNTVRAIEDFQAEDMP